MNTRRRRGARHPVDGDAVVVSTTTAASIMALRLVNDLIKPGVVGLQNGWWEQQGGSSSHVTNDKWKTLGRHPLLQSRPSLM